MCHGHKRIALVALILVVYNDSIIGRINARKNSNSQIQRNGNGGRIDTWSSNQLYMSKYPSYLSPVQENKEGNPGFSDGSRNPRPAHQDSNFNGNFQLDADSSKFKSQYQGSAAVSNNGSGRRKGNALRPSPGGKSDSDLINPSPNKYNDDLLKFTPEKNIRNEYNHKNWNSEAKTEGYEDFEIWPDNKQRGDNKIGSWQSDFGFAENSNQFSNKWKNSEREKFKTEGYSETFSGKQGGQWRGNSNNWNSDIDSKKYSRDKEISGTDNNTNKWKSKSVNENARPQTPSATDNLYKKFDNGKQPSLSENSSLNKNVEGIDWSEIERENKKSALILDLSQLWHPTYKISERKRPSSFRLTKKREAGGKGNATCICMEYEDCEPNDRVGFLSIVEDIKHDLRYSKALKCNAKGKTCCSVRALTENEEAAEYRKTSSMDRFPACGRRLSKRTPHDSSTGSLADRGDFPWILRLLYSEDDGDSVSERLQCGASLVHHSIALTTASCVLGAAPESLSALSGEWNIVTGHERNDIRQRKIKKIVVHPMFDAFHFANDLALLFLDGPFENYNVANAEVDTLVNTVCLPVPNDRWNIGKCLIVGWSFNNENGENQPLLKKIDLAIISQGKCRNRFNALESDRSYFGLEDPSFVCAYAKNEDPCLDDGGASLVCLSEEYPDSYVQIGFLSQKTICNQEQRTATFTTIFNILDWISQLETNYFSSES